VIGREVEVKEDVSGEGDGDDPVVMTLKVGEGVERSYGSSLGLSVRSPIAPDNQYLLESARAQHPGTTIQIVTDLI